MFTLFKAQVGPNGVCHKIVMLRCKDFAVFCNWHQGERSTMMSCVLHLLLTRDPDMFYIRGTRAVSAAAVPYKLLNAGHPCGSVARIESCKGCLWCIYGFCSRLATIK